MNTLAITLQDLFIFVPILLLIEGFFAGSEIALLSADHVFLKKKAKEGSAGASLALRLIDRPERIFSTTLLMTSFSVIGISAMIALYCFSLLADQSELLAILITSPLVVIFGELLPKTIYQRYANQISTWVSYPIFVAFYLCYPITFFTSRYTSRLSKVIGPIDEIITGKRRSTRENLINLLSYGRRESELKTTEKHMIKRILDFKDTEAKNALIPLVKVDAIDKNATYREALEKFGLHRHSRMPVYDERVDNIVGILEATDLFDVQSIDHDIRTKIRPAHYAPETQAVEDLMLDMHSGKYDMSVVVDEYGGAVGILTFEDIVEEIVGELEDEKDPRRKPIKPIDANKWIIHANTEIIQINEAIGIDIPEGEEYETLSGFLLQQFGRIPSVRDDLYLGNLKFTIRQASSRHIETVLVERQKTTTESH